ncbi:MAG: protein phosphatase 2C domain-containing protein, partial [Smithella sp.]
MKLHAIGMTDIGNIREENQDYFTILTAPCSDSGNTLLAVVADGVGGGKAGRIASKATVETLKDLFLKGVNNYQEYMGEAIERANDIIRDLAHDDACHGMATTCTALIVKGNSVIVGHVGDSRAYILRDGEIFRLTEDQTLPRKLFKEGLITEEELTHHPQGNVLTNAVGSRKNINVDIIPAEIKVKDTFILCSDGMYKYFTDDEIRDIVVKTGFESSPEHLIKTAKERGGEDNITVIVIHAGPDQLDKTTEILSTYIEEPTNNV